MTYWLGGFMKILSFVQIIMVALLVSSCVAASKVKNVPQELVDNAFRCTGGLYSEDAIKAKVTAAINKAELEANVDASSEFTSSLKTDIQSKDVSEELKARMLTCIQTSQ